MNILFITGNASQDAELKEFAETMNASAYFAHNRDESIQNLDKQEIDTVVLKMSRMEDAAILRYINIYYRDIKVLVYTNEEFDEAFSILNKGTYEMIRDPMMLKGLRDHLVH